MYRLTHVQHFTCTLWQLLYVFIHLTLTSKTILCVCWQCCLSESDSTVELCCYRLRRFTCSAAGRLKDKGRGGVASRRGGGWVTYHLMLPLLHNPTLSNGGKLLMKPQSRTIEDGKRKGERGGRERGEACPLLWCINANSWQGKPPALYQVCVFSRLAFWPAQHSNGKLRCPKALFESFTKQSAIASFVNMQLLPCTCGETQGIRITFSFLLHRKVSYFTSIKLVSKHRGEQIWENLKFGNVGAKD